MKPERIQVRYQGGLGERVEVTLRRSGRGLIFDTGEHRVRPLDVGDAGDLLRQQGRFVEVLGEAAFEKRFGVAPPEGAERDEEQRVVLTSETLRLLREAKLAQRRSSKTKSPSKAPSKKSTSRPANGDRK